MKIIIVYCCLLICCEKRSPSSKELPSLKQGDGILPRELYVYQNDTILQSVYIIFQGANEISFALTSKSKDWVATIRGEARLNPKQPDADNGYIEYLYPVDDQFNLDSNCRLSFSIDKTKSGVNIISANCRFNKTATTFTSVGTLKKNKSGVR